MRPIDRVRRVAEDIEGSDLSRRIGLDHGPTEVVALAASFDAMLDRLEHAAETQRQLIEEASHELRTPLSVLMTNADVTLAHPDPTIEIYRQGLERSRSAATGCDARSTNCSWTPADAPHHRSTAGRPDDHRPGVVDDAFVLAGAGRSD